MRILFCLLLPLKLFSQDLQGVWTGTLYNDTTRRFIPYEIAISENKGKLSGFSHTVFISSSNTQETGIKSLKIKKKNDKVLFEDDDLIYNNYKEPPPKGVRQYSVLNVVQSDSGWLLVGVFNTNRTKEYSSLTGTVQLRKKEKVEQTKIYPKLDELKLSKNLSFNQEKEKDIIAADKRKETVARKSSNETASTKLPTYNSSEVTENKDGLPIAFSENTVDYTVDIKTKDETEKIKKEKKDPVEINHQSLSKSQIPSTKAEPKKVASVLVKTNKISIPVIQPKQKADTLKISNEVANITRALNKTVTPTAVNDSKKDVAVMPKDDKRSPAAVLPKVKQEASIQNSKPATTQNTNVTKNELNTAQQNVKQPVIPATKALPGPVISSEDLAKRKIETIRSVDFKSDSLLLTLYDNGEVDGDIVSVILNGKVILSKQMLTTKALSQTIYITPDLGDSLQLILYAENLGSIAPNTGLLIIKDGDESYQVRFSGDLQKNAAIILRRKHN